MNENIIVPPTPPPPSTLSSQIETGAGGAQTQITEKTLIRVFCWFFCNYIFLKGRNINRGEGVQLFIIIFFYLFIFFFLGGGGGGCKSLFL